MNNKAQLLDIVMPVVILTIGLMMLVSSTLVIKTVRDLNVYNNDVANGLLDNGLEFYKGIDATFSLLFMGLILASAILGYYVNTHPFYFVIVILAIGALILVGVAMSNAFDAFMGASAFDSVRSLFPYSRLVVGNWPYHIHFSTVAWTAGLYIRIRGS